MDVHAHRESARTSDPDHLTAKVERIRQSINRNPRHRYETLTTPLNEGERFAIVEQQAEDERFR